jgi:hypothetical protein
VLLTLGFLIPVTIGVVLDRIGYGNWVFTPYRYFKVNLVDGVAATFNPYPWYQYFFWILELNPFVSLPLFFGVILYAKRMKFDALSAFVLTFFILHLFITNKEYRFLFPVLNLVPFMAAVGFQGFTGFLSNRKALAGYALINCIAFSVSTLRGASVETLWNVHMVNHYTEPGDVWLSNNNYLERFQDGYYHLEHHDFTLYHDGAELKAALATHPNAKVLLDGHLNDEVTQSILTVISDAHCKLLSTARPLWLFRLKDRFPSLGTLSYKAIYDCSLR